MAIGRGDNNLAAMLQQQAHSHGNTQSLALLLMMAVEQSDSELVALLLQYGADANAAANKKTALQLAAKARDLVMMRLLLVNGARGSFAADGATAWQIALETDDAEMVGLLVGLQDQHHLNELDAAGCSALHRAAELGRLEAMQVLLQVNANSWLAHAGGICGMFVGGCLSWVVYTLLALLFHSGMSH